MLIWGVHNINRPELFFFSLRHLYSCSRNVNPGDLLPVSLSSEPLIPSDKNDNTEEISYEVQEADEANRNDASKVIP